MGRRSHSQTLSMWANGDFVGRWTIGADGKSELQYDTAWQQSARGRPISVSLPFNLHNEPLKGARVSHYFDGLLPDSETIRKRVAARFKTGSIATFDLLAAIGRDCVGALQLLPDDAVPEGVGKIEGIVVDEEAIERHLLEVVSPDRFAAAKDPDDDFRISLAGAQEKDAFLWWDGQWMKPRGATPTTHILKLPIGMVGGRKADFTTSVDNEWLCLRLLKEYGLPTADARIATFGTQRVLVVERFDRVRSRDGTQLFRLIQEDFCQATGTSPLIKYESEGGPGLQQMSALLLQSQQAVDDMRTLMASQILFWMMRAPDGHAKNFSIQLLAGGVSSFKLTPLYDVMSAYPVMGDGPNQWAEQEIKLAMALLGKNKHYHVHKIARRHFNSTAKKMGYGNSAEPLLQEIITRTPEVVEKVRADLPPGFSEQVADKVLSGVLAAMRTLERMPTAS
ncbi:toxin HipA [Robbsia andropogonis]|uniref:Toxin HipA n=1 Tax=Robbsia andropogonis TaxID=28092 RepID=A0A0F5JW93_9BURK|nr:type II toxin-antitoxin system HipA family toxin [Robbsia andropogonis]KKB61934.1 toxin HipA [Robbsia andropogonis]MCP1120784.1 type II toxin-antitoxin system HipA family toxin [Robbsia andropogonis]MCP1130541.1 type II toxin-antitoxin system HipA family toxin [Robbsia andropogonis]